MTDTDLVREKISVGWLADKDFYLLIIGSTPDPRRFQQPLHDRHSAEQARSGRAQGYQTEARGDIVRRQ